ncbi:Dual specificity protein phosphatase PHS1 [Abeliophyllum distichum]|uniref:Dual specificity protein phosphatase PHS1 n=1 Tax=Abeliophyllum distichum TaxID=126358 RepID=A0ABD1PFA5_9LAMI
MAPDQNEDPYTFQKQEEEKEFDLGSNDSEAPLPLTVTSRVLYMLGDITSGPAFRFVQWLELVRKRSSKHRSSGFPHRPHRSESMFLSAGNSNLDSKSSPPSEQATEISLWERLGKASMLDIESSFFSWKMLSSLHHTEHSSSTEQSEDEMNKALEVTVNSGGVVFFALFNQSENDESSPKEAAAVIKFSSSRMATQSERLGYEFAKWLGVQTPQARVIHNTNAEWLQIREAAEKAKDVAIAEGDEISETTCSELLEALELSRCLLLMNYVHGSPLLESSNAFDSREAAEKTALALGRVLMLDLVIRNEDRLPCRHLRWRGNSSNLLLSEQVATSNVDALELAFDSAIKRYGPKVIRALQKERRATSVDSRLSPPNPGLVSQSSDLSDITESPKSSNMSLKSENSIESTSSDLHIVAIDSGVPRRPPAGKRANDQANYPQLVELLINSSEYASQLLHEITGGKLGSSPEDSDRVPDLRGLETTSAVHEFRSGFRAALRDLQGFHIFLLTLHQKLDSLLRAFLNIINKSSCGDLDKDDLVVPESPLQAKANEVHCPSPPSRDRIIVDNSLDLNDSESHRTTSRPSSSGCKEISDSCSPMSRDSWHGKFSKGSGEPLRSLRLTSKLRDFHKCAKVDAELNKEIEQWNDMLKNDAIKLCQENNFNTGFFEGSDSNCVVDAYELKVRLEHILERIVLISDAGNTEKPSSISGSLLIGGALAARSVYTLQHLGITHILCLCSNEIGQSDSQFPELFDYKNFSICDDEDTNISDLFNEAHDFIDHVEQIGGKVLVHCFEGRSRSATVVLAYLMLRKNFTLVQAWNTLKRVHRRAQPNDGFAKILLDLDLKLHGKVSMEWHQRRPSMKVCPICGKNAGLSSSSLKLHLQKAHKKLSSGSVDSATTLEIQKLDSNKNELVLEQQKIRGDSTMETRQKATEEQLRKLDKDMSDLGLAYSTLVDKKELRALFRCDEKYTLGHVYKNRMLNYMVVDEEDDEEDKDTEGPKTEGTGKEEEKKIMQISLDALMGSVKHKTIRISNRIKGRHIAILIDSGCTYNFIDERLIKSIGYMSDHAKPLTMTVANGQKMESGSVYPPMIWQMLGMEFQYKLRSLKLGGSDMMLGVNCLSQFGLVTFDFTQGHTNFVSEGKKVTLSSEATTNKFEMITGYTSNIPGFDE